MPLLFKSTCIFAFVLTALTTWGQTPQDRQTILGILDRQTLAWNRGNVTEFMRGYWESDSLLYIGKTGVRKGYRTTLENYKKNYPDRATMGTLAFTILKLEFLGENAAFVVGRWHLTRPEKGDVGGHFSLTWRKMGGEWVIVADHSS